MRAAEAPTQSGAAVVDLKPTCRRRPLSGLSDQVVAIWFFVHPGDRPDGFLENDPAAAVIAVARRPSTRDTSQAARKVNGYRVTETTAERGVALNGKTTILPSQERGTRRSNIMQMVEARTGEELTRRQQGTVTRPH
ncbi:hypothetical protein GWK47_026048 [Chionoecetes opilio]|uniref:Uncharacterized protein n=1 Tax=Chionoecetes opilio TaxID=41210 RepID=A0A8J8WBV6_CHIOP|nr:hypothetical protein GWK47_026048 [Chionoecetes opilio]